MKYIAVPLSGQGSFRSFYREKRFSWLRFSNHEPTDSVLLRVSGSNWSETLRVPNVIFEELCTKWLIARAIIVEHPLQSVLPEITIRLAYDPDQPRMNWIAIAMKKLNFPGRSRAVTCLDLYTNMTPYTMMFFRSQPEDFDALACLYLKTRGILGP